MGRTSSAGDGLLLLPGRLHPARHGRLRRPRVRTLGAIGAPPVELRPEDGLHGNRDQREPTTFIPAGYILDLSVFTPWASDAVALVDRINRNLMARSMSAAMKTQIVNAVNAVPLSNPTLRVRQAIYLVATSAQYQAQR